MTTSKPFYLTIKLCNSKVFQVQYGFMCKYSLRHTTQLSYIMLSTLYSPCLKWPMHYQLHGRHLQYLPTLDGLHDLISCNCGMPVHGNGTSIELAFRFVVCNITHVCVWSVLPSIVSTTSSEPNGVQPLHSRLILLVACLPEMRTSQIFSAKSPFSTYLILTTQNSFATIYFNIKKLRLRVSVTKINLSSALQW